MATPRVTTKQRKSDGIQAPLTPKPFKYCSSIVSFVLVLLTAIIIAKLTGMVTAMIKHRQEAEFKMAAGIYRLARAAVATQWRN